MGLTKKLHVALLFLCFFCRVLHGQDDSNLKGFFFGLLVEGNHPIIRISENPSIGTGLTNGIEGISMESNIGYSVGVGAYLYLKNELKVGFVPTFSVMNNNMTYFFQNQVKEEKRVREVALELPVSFICTFNYDKNVSPLLIVGGRFMHELRARNDEDILHIRKNDFAIDFGVGIEIRKKDFNITPSLIYSRGMINLDNGDIDIYNAAIEEFRTDRIALQVVFYGQ